MLEILGKIGFDWQVALANLVNFLIIFILLRAFVFKSLAKAIRDRNTKISDGLKNAEDALLARDKAEVDKNKIITDAHREAGEIIKEIQTESENRRLALVAKAEAEAQAIIEQGKKVLEVEKAKMIAEAKTELAGLVIHATEKVLEDSSAVIDPKLVDQAIFAIQK